MSIQSALNQMFGTIAQATYQTKLLGKVGEAAEGAQQTASAADKALANQADYYEWLNQPREDEAPAREWDFNEEFNGIDNILHNIQKTAAARVGYQRLSYKQAAERTQQLRADRYAKYNKGGRN